MNSMCTSLARCPGEISGSTQCCRNKSSDPEMRYVMYVLLNKIMLSTCNDQSMVHTATYPCLWNHGMCAWYLFESLPLLLEGKLDVHSNRTLGCGITCMQIWSDLSLICEIHLVWLICVLLADPLQLQSQSFVC